ncbi:MAG TPA: heme-binding protein [Bryobacteraceae bacterium]|jgi:uncharacterized protein GlcG (DUF336 family)
MKNHLTRFAFTALAGIACAFPGLAQVNNNNDGGTDLGCQGLPSYLALKNALVQAVATETSGLNNQMWGTIVDRNGIVCAVAYSGSAVGSQWLGSRVIAAQKANTANDFSLDASAASNGSGGALALSTANLYSAVQPGGSLFGLQESNPVNPAVAYAPQAAYYGTPQDPMVGNRIGGVNVFGGGLALYGPGHVLVGAVGVSGDTSCSDHFIAWRTRNLLGLDHLGTVIPGPASLFNKDATHPDNIILDITANPAGGTGNSASGFGHPSCLNTGDPSKLPAVSN